METRQNNSGNSQVNSTRETFNGNVSKLFMLGKSKRVFWDNQRRNRTI